MTDNYKLRFVHFAPDNKKYVAGQPTPYDKTKIWGVIVKDADDEDTLSGYGYIDNIFGIEEINKEKLYDINILAIKYLEHSNGGRTNKKEYNSVEDYWADPKVKENVCRSYKEGLSFKFSYNGNPDEIDVKVVFEVVDYPGHTFTLYENLYTSKPPKEWYSECLSHVIDELKQKSSYPTHLDALEAQIKTDDLFGERYFPVLKAPIALEEQMVECAAYFKGHSKTLTDGENVYIGIRSKSHELGGITEIYEQGGTILVDTQWDWE
jgi:hypothetical protein